MERINLYSFRAFAKTLEGIIVETQKQRRKFTVQVIPGALIFTPQSTGKPRALPDRWVEHFLVAFAEVESFQTVNYQHIAVNASYLLAIIARYLHR
jgi:hypothetical protein